MSLIHFVDISILSLWPPVDPLSNHGESPETQWPHQYSPLWDPEGPFRVYTSGTCGECETLTGWKNDNLLAMANAVWPPRLVLLRLKRSNLVFCVQCNCYLKCRYCIVLQYCTWRGTNLPGCMYSTINAVRSKYSLHNGSLSCQERSGLGWCRLESTKQDMKSTITSPDTFFLYLCTRPDPGAVDHMDSTVYLATRGPSLTRKHNFTFHTMILEGSCPCTNLDETRLPSNSWKAWEKACLVLPTRTLWRISNCDVHGLHTH